MKDVISFNLSVCPMCKGKMYLLESRYDAYELDQTSGKYITKKAKTDHLSEFVCIDCGYHVLAKHSIYGVLPTKSRILEDHKDELEKGKNLSSEIGYVEN